MQAMQARACRTPINAHHRGDELYSALAPKPTIRSAAIR